MCILIEHTFLAAISMHIVSIKAFDCPKAGVRKSNSLAAMAQYTFHKNSFKIWKQMSELSHDLCSDQNTFGYLIQQTLLYFKEDASSPLPETSS